MKKLLFSTLLFAMVGGLSSVYAQTAYITNNGTDSVSVINVATNTVMAKIAVGTFPYGVSVSHDGTKVYVANYRDNTISVINTATNAVTATIAVGSCPYGLSVNPDGTKVYVPNQCANTVSVINTATNAVTATIAVGGRPDQASVSPDGTKVYVTNYYDNTLSVINSATDTVMATIVADSINSSSSHGVAVSPDGTKVYVTIQYGNILSVINTATNAVTASIATGSSANGVAVSPDGTKVYVTNLGDNTVSVINTATNTVTATIAVGSNPYGISVSPDGTKVYVANGVSPDEGYDANNNDGTVSVINTATNTVSATIIVGGHPVSFGNFISTHTTQCNSYLTVSAGPNRHMLFGYAPEQCKTNTAIVTGGTAPFTYNWTLNRPLQANVVNSSGDETMTGANTASVTLCLLDTAILCVKVTDANGCMATGCDTMFAEDVRCFAGNSGIQKVKMCHNKHQICVDSNAVHAHLNEGDYIGSCVNSSNIVGQLIAEPNGGREISIYPNPGHSEFIVSMNLSDDEMRSGVIRIFNVSGQLVKKVNVNSQSKINININDPGIYIVQLSTNKQTITRKLTVLR